MRPLALGTGQLHLLLQVPGQLRPLIQLLVERSQLPKDLRVPRLQITQTLEHRDGVFRTYELVHQDTGTFPQQRNQRRRIVGQGSFLFQVRFQLLERSIQAIQGQEAIQGFFVLGDPLEQSHPSRPGRRVVFQHIMRSSASL